MLPTLPAPVTLPLSVPIRGQRRAGGGRLARAPAPRGPPVPATSHGCPKGRGCLLVGAGKEGTPPGPGKQFCAVALLQGHRCEARRCCPARDAAA